jgi:hypothetical protein
LPFGKDCINIVFYERYKFGTQTRNNMRVLMDVINKTYYFDGFMKDTPGIEEHLMNIL